MLRERREFLTVCGKAALGLPLIMAPGGCASPIVDQLDIETGLSLGYTVGEVTPDSALVWLRPAPEAGVAVQYGLHERLEKFFTSKYFSARKETDYTVQIPLKGLEAGSHYYYRGVVAGKKPGPIARFDTAPQPGDSSKVSFCFSGDTRESYQPFTVMDAVRAQQPDFFLYLGDTIYADRGGTARSLEEFWKKYRGNRSDAAMQRCLAATSFYVMWDDHEVEDNFLPDHPLMPVGRRAFFDYWPIRRISEEPERLYRSFRWGRGCEIFILDPRQYRDPRRGTMLGRAQKRWLFDGLIASQALFKFVATGVPLNGGGADRWDGYPAERAEILRYISENKIRGVIFLSADVHYAAVTRIPGGAGLKDITAGPLASPLNRVNFGTANRYEFFLAENFNFAKITVDPKIEPHHALIEFIDQDNRLFHRTKIFY